MAKHIESKLRPAVEFYTAWTCFGAAALCVHSPWLLHWLLAWAGQLGVVTALSEPYALSKAWMYSGIAAT